jgi:exodeoxyribonuclease-3
MRITSWNVNGIRAVHRKELFIPMLEQVQPDVLLLQETKSEEHQLSDELKTAGEYTSYFNSSKTRKGYSGVAIYTKEAPKEVRCDMNTPKYDQEGRVITAFFDEITICGIYFPNGGGGPERLQYKLEFYDAFLEYVARLEKNNPVIWGGDINTAHHAIDLARPKENEKNTGFLPEERAWLDEVEANGWVDTFRHFHPNKKDAYTYWDMKTRARERNVGWRIDYLFTSPALLAKLQNATIHHETLGSDHCPISVEVGV